MSTNRHHGHIAQTHKHAPRVYKPNHIENEWLFFWTGVNLFETQIATVYLNFVNVAFRVFVYFHIGTGTGTGTCVKRDTSSAGSCACQRDLFPFFPDATFYLKFKSNNAYSKSLGKYTHPTYTHAHRHTPPHTPPHTWQPRRCLYGTWRPWYSSHQHYNQQQQYQQPKFSYIMYVPRT